MKKTPSEFAAITIRDWLSEFASFGTATPEIVIYSSGVEIPRQAIVIQPTAYDATEYRVTIEISLVLDQADFTESSHREAAAELRERLTPPAPRYDPGTPSLSCNTNFAAFAQAQRGGRVFDLINPDEIHNAADGRLIYLLTAQAVVVVD